MLSPEVLDKLQAEADALGLKGATAISLAVRAGLTERKKVGKVPDERTQTYYVAGRYVVEGIAHPVDGVAPAEGLLALNELAKMVGEMHGYNTENWGDIVGAQIPSGRVNLSRKGEAHFQVKLSTNPEANVVVSWIDLWVFPTEAAASLCAQSLKAGKIF